MADNLIVRPLQPEDREYWFRMWRGYQEFYQVEVEDRISEIIWSRLLDNDQPMWCLIAEIGGQPVGMMNYILHANTWTDQPVCYLEDLFVDAPLRGQGTGRLLIETLVKEAKTKGWFRLYWMTHKDSATARILYDKLAVATDWVRYDAVME
jgi:GNAT superfamily N-acetyltransferase